MQTLTIEVDNAVNAYNTGDNATKAFMAKLFPKQFAQKITDRVKTFEDALSIKGMTRREFDELSKTLSKDELGYRKAKIIIEVLNEGKPGRYYPIMVKNDAGSGFSFNDYDLVYTASAVGSRLKLATPDLVKYFATQFLDVINEFWS